MPMRNVRKRENAAELTCRGTRAKFILAAMASKFIDLPRERRNAVKSVLTTVHRSGTNDIARVRCKNTRGIPDGLMHVNFMATSSV